MTVSFLHLGSYGTIGLCICVQHVCVHICVSVGHCVSVCRCACTMGTHVPYSLCALFVHMCLYTSVRMGECMCTCELCVNSPVSVFLSCACICICVNTCTSMHIVAPYVGSHLFLCWLFLHPQRAPQMRN